MAGQNEMIEIWMSANNGQLYSTIESFHGNASRREDIYLTEFKTREEADRFMKKVVVRTHCVSTSRPLEDVPVNNIKWMDVPRCLIAELARDGDACEELFEEGCGYENSPAVQHKGYYLR